MKRVWTWIRWALALAAVAIAILTGKKVLDRIIGEAGKVEGTGDNFLRIPDDPGVLLVSKKDSPREQVEVVLPPGISSKDVRVVKIVSMGRAVVEVLP